MGADLWTYVIDGGGSQLVRTLHSFPFSLVVQCLNGCVFLFWNLCCFIVSVRPFRDGNRFDELATGPSASSLKEYLGSGGSPETHYHQECVCSDP
eukprot:TRINITY_DN619_c0_g2_i7.p1 TRINITY_DN619_c0_g2~~TRINITY_DN619_c0_g2_i7.p1  ORF type:complete len:108 (-),score=21.39 TRINITY_DN619_c0_g2_i7:478-762(-)